MENNKEKIEKIITSHGDKTWIRFYKDGVYVREISFFQAFKDIIKRAFDLEKNLGLSRGDVVLVQMANSIEAVINYFAFFYLGVIAIPVHPEEPELRLDFIKKNSGARGVFLSTGYVSFDNPSKINEPPHEKTDTVIYTSGTTGDPKGVCLSFSHWERAGNDMNLVNGFDAKTVYGGPLPMYHCTGFGVSMFGSFLSGATLILFDGITENFLDIVNKEKINVVGVVPAVLYKLFEAKKDWVPHSDFRHFICSASYLDPSLLRNVLDNWGVKVMQGYGLTEVTHFSTFLNPGLSDSEYESVMFPEPSIGYSLPQAENILDPDTNEILIRTKNSLLGYLGKEKFDSDSWFSTGDVGMEKEINGRRFLYIKGRIKEIINRAGEKINPIEIENEIRALGFSKEFAIFGFPHPKYGEEIGIVSLEPIDVSLFEPLPFHIRPKQSFIMEEIPRTYTGKVQRGKIKKYLFDE